MTIENEQRSYDKVTRTISGEFRFDRPDDRQSLADTRSRVVICDTKRPTRPDKPSGRDGESKQNAVSLPRLNADIDTYFLRN